MIRLAVLLTGWAGVGWAACPADTETFLSCSMSGGSKVVDVCVGGAEVTYAFGPPGGVPELSLAEPLETVDYRPWPGIGRTMFERVLFQNGTVTYDVAATIDRDFDDRTESVAVTVSGGITVLQGETELATLICDPDSADAPFGVLSDAKARIGQCWDLDSRVWAACQR